MRSGNGCQRQQQQRLRECIARGSGRVPVLLTSRIENPVARAVLLSIPLFVPLHGSLLALSKFNKNIINTLFIILLCYYKFLLENQEITYIRIIEIYY